MAAAALARAAAAVASYPFQCPPAAASAECLQEKSWADRVGLPAEGIFLKIMDGLLLYRSADPAAKQRVGEYEAFLSLTEGFHILHCVEAYKPPCVPTDAYRDSKLYLCEALRRRVGELEAVGMDISVLRSEHECWGGPAVGALTVFVPFAGPALHGWFLKAPESRAALKDWQRWKGPFPRVAPRHPDLPPLLYPAEYAPPGACDPARVGLAAALPGRPGHRWPWRDMTGQFARDMETGDILAKLERSGVTLSRFVVNLGAANGLCGWGSLYDPANCLLLDGAMNMSGVLFEGAAVNFETILRKYGRRAKVHLRLGWATPSTAARDVLAVMPRGASVDLLKVDVDNCDSCFVRAIVEAGIVPKLIHVEVHAGLPPRLAAGASFRTKPDAGMLGHHGGSNPGSVGEFLRVAPDHRLLIMEFGNALLIHKSLYGRVAGPASASEDERWRLGYFCHPLRTTYTYSPHVQTRLESSFDAAVFGDPAVQPERLHALLGPLLHTEQWRGLHTRLRAEDPRDPDGAA